MTVELRADCGRCVGLCCVAPAFVRSADFALDKPAGQPCPNLRADHGCGIHDRLRDRGFPGCAVFDCFGAGQRLTQTTFGGRDWRDGPQTAAAMFAAFPVLRQLHELLWYLAEAAARLPTSALRDEVGVVRERTEALAARDADGLAAVDAAGYRQEVGDLLGRVSAAIRADVADRAADRSRADLFGADLRGADLRGASLRGSYLIGADLRRADLRWADLLGADLRAADLRGADLTDSVFLTQPQVDAARGDATTRIPATLRRPDHWT